MQLPMKGIMLVASASLIAVIVSASMTSVERLRKRAIFFGRMLRNPKSVGAVAPASLSLAKAMVSSLDPTEAGKVLELGPGTGVITRALVDRGFCAQRLTLVEIDPVFVKQLRSEFDTAQIIEADAIAFARNHAKNYSAIVSSLPLLNLPRDVTLKFIEEILSQLPPNGVFLQYSYGLTSPFPRELNATICCEATIFRNIPPAKVWAIQRLAK